MDNLEKQKINELLLESYLESERQYEESMLLRLGVVNKRSKQWSKFAKKIVKKNPSCTVCHDDDYL